MITKHQNFDQLINNIYQTHNVLQENAKRAINQNLTIRNWLIGYYIVEYEQYGKDRAKYGTMLLEELAIKLKSKGIKGLRKRELNTCRKFYITYPQIWRTVSAKLKEENNQYSLPININEIEISQTISVIASNEIEISPEILLSKLSYSHFIELLQSDDSLERFFYEVETIKNNWSVRELERAINTALYVRTGLSKNKKAIIDKFKNQKPVQSIDIIRDPYFLEFLGMEERLEYSESELEQAILDHLQKFLMELGTGFCFEARQKRITFDNTHYHIDLVFYHRILKSHILIDLKIGKFDHADAGQMNVYLNYYKNNEMSEDDNPPIGLILCGSKGKALAKYATSGMDNQLFVSKYLIQLPDKNVLENFIKKEIYK
ncbi:MAG: PDDEXK nuclease domain-containing protein [Bacteroidales bacterium]|jgi:predicted nuclease of restriction endonuclease-like (RecB) superfamily|nr:PDDEXK nuclease domain-containing protein [Bacteroidales bacterium]